MLRIAHHRRFTANHTWHVNVAHRRYFVKASPNSEEAQAECIGHDRTRLFYPVPPLLATWRWLHWTLLVYDRWPFVGRDRGLLLDLIAHAEDTDDSEPLEACMTDLLAHYSATIRATLRTVPRSQTCTKLYGARAAHGGRLDGYYGARTPWQAWAGDGLVQDAELRIVANGRTGVLNYSHIVAWLRRSFAASDLVHAAMTQGDPTDFNIGWFESTGPVWFDCDTGGLNALAGEFACFLMYQRIHGCWLTPRYNPSAFRDHPIALRNAEQRRPTVTAAWDRVTLRIDHRHRCSAARQLVMWRYLYELVLPIARDIAIRDVMEWLRPYIVMRLLAVYDLSQLSAGDAALVVALLAESLDPDTALPALLGLAPQPHLQEECPCPVPSPLSRAQVPASAPRLPSGSPCITTSCSRT